MLFMPTVTKATLAINKEAAGAGVLGLVGFAALFVVAVVFFVTENYFVAMADHVVRAARLRDGRRAREAVPDVVHGLLLEQARDPGGRVAPGDAGAARNMLTIRRDGEGNVKAGPLVKGMTVKLPDNPLVRDIQTLLEKNPDLEYAEYIAHEYYVQCHELYDHSSAHLEFVADRNADVRPDRDDHRSDRHVRGPRRRGDRRVPVAAARARAQVHAVRRACSPRCTRSSRRASISASRRSTTTSRRSAARSRCSIDNKAVDRGAVVKYVRLRAAEAKFDIWPVVYIDLMTQIMMFFVILWSISQMQAQKKGVTTPSATQTVHEVTLPGDVLFPSGKTELTPAGRGRVREAVQGRHRRGADFETGGLHEARARDPRPHRQRWQEGQELRARLPARAGRVQGDPEVRPRDRRPRRASARTPTTRPRKRCPLFTGTLTPAQAQALGEARSKNRRITIEDQVNSVVKDE